MEIVEFSKLEYMLDVNIVKGLCLDFFFFFYSFCFSCSLLMILKKGVASAECLTCLILWSQCIAFDYPELTIKHVIKSSFYKAAYVLLASC